MDMQQGGYEVSFRFNPDGGQRFGNLTRSHVPLDGGAFKYDLAIVLDDILQSAPTINDIITDNGRITGGFDETEVPGPGRDHQPRKPARGTLSHARTRDDHRSHAGPATRSSRA